MTDSKIRKNIMRRVRAIHALRSAASGIGASVIVLIASLYLIGREVWVARVFQNMPRLAEVGAFLRFCTYAFARTDVSVQALILLTIAAGVWFLRESVRLVAAEPVRFARP